MRKQNQTNAQEVQADPVLTTPETTPQAEDVVIQESQVEPVNPQEDPLLSAETIQEPQMDDSSSDLETPKKKPVKRFGKDSA